MTSVLNKAKFTVFKLGPPTKMSSQQKDDPPKPLHVRFINTERPDIPGHLKGHRSSIHAHAARATHAKRRRRRQASTPKPGSDESPQQQEDGYSKGLLDTLTPTPKSSSSITSLITINPVHLVHLEPSATPPNPPNLTERFLLNHYITVVLPYIHSRCTKLKARGQMYLDAMDSEWVSLALHDAGYRTSVFLKTSRHLSLIHPHHDQKEVFARLAARYKRVCMLRLSDAVYHLGSMRGDRVTDSLVALTLELAHDEILLGQMVVGRRHVEGAAEMVRRNVGSRTLGLNGFLETVFYKSMGEVGLLLHPAEPVPGENLFMSVL